MSLAVKSKTYKRQADKAYLATSARDHFNTVANDSSVSCEAKADPVRKKPKHYEVSGGHLRTVTRGDARKNKQRAYFQASFFSITAKAYKAKAGMGFKILLVFTNPSLEPLSRRHPWPAPFCRSYSLQPTRFGSPQIGQASLKRGGKRRRVRRWYQQDPRMNTFLERDMHCVPGQRSHTHSGRMYSQQTNSAMEVRHT